MAALCVFIMLYAYGNPVCIYHVYGNPMLCLGVNKRLCNSISGCCRILQEIIHENICQVFNIFRKYIGR